MKNILPLFPLFFIIPFLGYSQNSTKNIIEDDIEYEEIEEIETQYKSIFDEQTFEIEYPKTLKSTNNFNEIEDNTVTKNIIENKFINTKQTPENSNISTNPRIQKKSILRKISRIKKPTPQKTELTIQQIDATWLKELNSRNL